MSIESVAKFHEWLRESNRDDTVDLLYRGQSDACWPVKCSAVRRLTSNQQGQDSENTIDLLLMSRNLINYLELLVDKARSRDFLPPGFTKTLSDLELLAQLQHHGAATGFIDFTRQPLIALWFACREPQKGGAIYRLHPSKTKKISKYEPVGLSTEWEKE